MAVDPAFPSENLKGKKHEKHKKLYCKLQKEEIQYMVLSEVKKILENGFIGLSKRAGQLLGDRRKNGEEEKVRGGRN